jgi:hypothetical protein
MNSQEFVIWLKGFTEGVHEYNITPKQWDLLKDKLAKVDDNTIPMGGVIVDHNTFKTVYPNWTGINPYTTRGPEAPTGTTSGYLSASYITYNPGAITFTATSGSNVTYTTNGTPNWYTVNKTENVSGNK